MDIHLIVLYAKTLLSITHQHVRQETQELHTEFQELLQLKTIGFVINLTVVGNIKDSVEMEFNIHVALTIPELVQYHSVITRYLSMMMKFLVPRVVQFPLLMEVVQVQFVVNA